MPRGLCYRKQCLADTRTASLGPGLDHKVQHLSLADTRTASKCPGFDHRVQYLNIAVTCTACLGPGLDHRVQHLSVDVAIDWPSAIMSGEIVRSGGRFLFALNHTSSSRPVAHFFT